MILYLGLAGPMGSGKGTVAAILSQYMKEHGIHVMYWSLSDEIRQEVMREGRAAGRDILKQTANRIRATAGSGAWARLVASRIADELNELEAENALVVIDGIRNPGEVRELDRRFQGRFRLLGVIAPDEIVRRNLLSRKRDDEPERILADEYELQKLLNAEMGVGEPDFGHDVKTCLDMSSWTPINNNGSLANLESKVRQFASANILPLFEVTVDNTLANG